MPLSHAAQFQRPIHAALFHVTSHPNGAVHFTDDIYDLDAILAGTVPDPSRRRISGSTPPASMTTGRWLFVALMTAQLLALPPIRAQQPKPPDVEALLDRLDDLYRSKSSIARMEVSVTSPRSTRTMRLKAWTRGQDEALILIEAPAREEGTATLRVGANLWNYLPRIARTIRVPPSMMLGSWMGTDFTNDDLVKESSLRKDFVSAIDRRSTSPPGWWITLTVRPGVVGRWARIEMLVTDDLLPVQERHFDRKGRLARTMVFDEIKTLGGRRLPVHLTLTPTDVEGQRTEMTYLELQFDPPIPDDTFSLSRLERGR
jgi:outer membrane lipoprotein-sorting protein